MKGDIDRKSLIRISNESDIWILSYIFDFNVEPVGNIFLPVLSHLILVNSDLDSEERELVYPKIFPHMLRSDHMVCQYRNQ